MFKTKKTLQMLNFTHCSKTPGRVKLEVRHKPPN